jgi:hypothetical protein
MDADVRGAVFIPPEPWIGAAVVPGVDPVSAAGDGAADGMPALMFTKRQMAMLPEE